MAWETGSIGDTRHGAHARYSLNELMLGGAEGAASLPTKTKTNYSRSAGDIATPTARSGSCWCRPEGADGDALGTFMTDTVPPHVIQAAPGTLVYGSPTSSASVVRPR